MSAPLTSIIIPTYNHRRFVASAVESALGQTYGSIEVIVVDDGSTDGTAEELAAFGDRIRYVWQENRERAEARNHGLRLARGQYVSFLDSDDTLKPDKVAHQAAQLAADPGLGLVACGAEVIDADGKVLGVAEPWRHLPVLDAEAILLSSPLSVHTVLVRRSELDGAGGFRSSVQPAEDWDLWLRLGARGCRMGWTREVLCTRRIHDANTIGNPERHTAAALAALDDFFAMEDAAAFTALRERATVGVLLGGAGREYAAGQVGAAQEHVREAIRIEPRLLDANGAELVEGLLAHLGNRAVVADGGAFVSAVYEGLPEEIRAQVGGRDRARAAAAMKSFYGAVGAADRTALWRAWRAAVRADPGWLANRGVWVTLARSLGWPRTPGRTA
jgi:hypothetical protein